MTSREQPTNETNDEDVPSFCVCDYRPRRKCVEHPEVAVPTPVPLEAREWLYPQLNRFAKGPTRGRLQGLAGAYLTYAGATHQPRCEFIENAQANSTFGEICDWLESYSSHVNAALMEKIAKLTEIRNECMCFWCGEKFPFPRKGTPEEKAEALTTHAMNCPDNPCHKYYAAESRISELERERDEAREAYDNHLLACGVMDERLKLIGLTESEEDFCDWKNTRAESAESQLSTTQEALRNLLRHCDVNPEGESVFERDVIYARALLAERVLSPPTKLP